MQIEKDRVVSFHYRLADESGQPLEDSHSGDTVLYLHGHRNIIPGLEQALEGKTTGDTVEVTLPPERAYGLRRDNAVQRVPVKHLLQRPKQLRPGKVVQINTSEGAREAVVVKVGKFNIDVDTNHPLAGKTLCFTMEVTDVRAASDEEIAHGHAHGVGGHQH